MKKLWNNIKDPLFYLSIILIATIFLLCLIPRCEGAVIATDSLNTISIEGQIDVGDTSDMVKALGEIDIKYAMANHLELIINSIGGDANVAQTICYLLKRWSVRNNVKIKTVTYTYAGSGAALIFLMGDIRTMSTEAQFMVHEVRVWLNDQWVTLDKITAADIGESQMQGLRNTNALVYQVLSHVSPTYPKEFVINSRKIMVKDAILYGIATEAIRLF